MSFAKVNVIHLPSTYHETSIKPLYKPTYMATRQKANASDDLQLVIDSALDVVQVFRAVRDEKKNIIDFIWIANNKQAVELVGEVIGKSLIEQNPGVIRAGIFDRMVQVTETGIPQRYEQNYSFEQFKSQWFYQSIVKYEDGVLSTTRDITPLKIAEQQIIKGNNLLQSVFNSSLNAITVFDAVRNEDGDIIDFKYLLTNSLTKEMERGDPYGERFLERHPDLANTDHFANLKMVAETGLMNEWIIYYDS